MWKCCRSRRKANITLNFSKPNTKAFKCPWNMMSMLICDEINYKYIIHYETIMDGQTIASLEQNIQDIFIANFYYCEKLNQLLGLTFGIVYCFFLPAFYSLSGLIASARKSCVYVVLCFLKLFSSLPRRLFLVLVAPQAGTPTSGLSDLIIVRKISQSRRLETKLFFHRRGKNWSRVEAGFV